jgi:hypothetical protein
LIAAAGILASQRIKDMESKRPGLADLLRNGSDPKDSPEGRRAGRDAVLNFFKALGSRDRDALAAVVTEDVVHEISGNFQDEITSSSSG